MSKELVQLEDDLRAAHSSWDRDSMFPAMAESLFERGYRLVVSDSDTVERVAKAMTNDGSDQDLWGMCSEVAREAIRQQARAAIEAMKETK